MSRRSRVIRQKVRTRLHSAYGGELTLMSFTDQPKKKSKAKSGPVRSFTRVVSRGAVKKWKKLSQSGASVIKTSLDDADVYVHL